MAKTTKTKKETPLMKQFNRIKAKYPDAILLFRVGDFYETFGNDAILSSKALGITLTKRANGSAAAIELAGFPHHALNTYLPKLVKAGYRVAICEQLEDPKKTKKIVKRGVTELVTPGLAMNENILEHASNNYLASLHFGKKTIGVSFVDISTGEFLLAEGDAEYIEKLFQSLRPAEIIFSKTEKARFDEAFNGDYYTFCIDEWVYKEDYANESLLSQFKTTSFKGFGVEDLKSGIIAAGAIIHYLKESAHSKLEHITALRRIKADKYLWLDRFTIRNLELLYSPFDSGTPLIHVMDKSITPMGSRLLKKWMALPLKLMKPIQQRLDIVEYLLNNKEEADELRTHIKQIGDIERLIARVPTNRINPRQVLQLQKALSAIEPVKALCEKAKINHLNVIGEHLNICASARDRIARELTEDPPVQVAKGGVIADGVSKELDELRRVVHSGKEILLEIQQRESERTGIKSLKIGFNNVFGYYLEVTNKYKDEVPPEWIRKQTLTSAERYITEELKTYESKIFGAEDKILLLEGRLYEELVQSLNEYIRPIQLNAFQIARLDCLLSFAQTAEQNDYCKPEMNEGFQLDIKAGRHPVIEQQMPLGESYVANDVYLDDETQQIIIVTGPNMAGKSALLRQTALIVLMAQMGSFIPADSAKIGLVDKIFTRVGASDNISSGESTFMVEMNETASIMNNITHRSLILLDEIGRGTSTYDGISIAWALTEYLHQDPNARPKTLFATHYHELTELSNRFERIKNFSVSTREVNNQVIFLRKLLPGGVKHSFGIHVAKMAGMPKKIIQRANEILAELEKKGMNNQDIDQTLKKMPQKDNFQLSIFQMDDPSIKSIKETLKDLDINTLTPIEALLKLQEIKSQIEG